MKKLELTKIVKEGGKVFVTHHRFNDDNTDNDSTGIWEWDAYMTDEAIVEKAKTMVDADIEVSLAV